MNKSILTMVGGAMLLAGTAFAAESTTTTTTWTNDQGTIIRQSSTTNHYRSFTDPTLDVKIGTELPQSVTTYSLPDTIKVEQPDRYAYVIVNEHPVVVEKSTRRVIHTW